VTSRTVQFLADQRRFDRVACFPDGHADPRQRRLARQRRGQLIRLGNLSAGSAANTASDAVSYTNNTLTINSNIVNNARAR